MDKNSCIGENKSKDFDYNNRCNENNLFNLYEEIMKLKKNISNNSTSSSDYALFSNESTDSAELEIDGNRLMMA